MGVSSYVVKKEAVIMGRIDAETKEYVKRPEVFADLFNHLLYDGKPVIEPGKLSEMDTTELVQLFLNNWTF